MAESIPSGIRPVLSIAKGTPDPLIKSRPNCEVDVYDHMEKELSVLNNITQNPSGVVGRIHL